MTIGLQQTSYTVTEDDILVLACTEVESGSISGSTIITIDFETTNGGAQGIGMFICFMYVTVSSCSSK